MNTELIGKFMMSRRCLSVQVFSFFFFFLREIPRFRLEFQNKRVMKKRINAVF